MAIIKPNPNQKSKIKIENVEINVENENIPSSDDVVDAGSVVVHAVRNGIGHNGRHRVEEGQAAPEAVTNAQVGGVQLPGFAREKPLARIALVPKVQIADLRTRRYTDPAQVSP
jgi:hypothetical protein